MPQNSKTILLRTYAGPVSVLASFYKISSDFLESRIDYKYPGKVRGKVMDLVADQNSMEGMKWAPFAAYLSWYQGNNLKGIPRNDASEEPWKLSDVFKTEEATPEILRQYQEQEAILQVLDPSKLAKLPPELKSMATSRNKSAAPVESEASSAVARPVASDLGGCRNFLIMPAIIGLLAGAATKAANVFKAPFLSAATKVVGGSALWAACVGFEGTLITKAIRNVVKSSALEEYQDKDEAALSALPDSCLDAFNLGVKAAMSTRTMLFSYISPTAIKHPKAYYAGLEAKEHEAENTSLLKRLSK